MTFTLTSFMAGWHALAAISTISAWLSALLRVQFYQFTNSDASPANGTSHEADLGSERMFLNYFILNFHAVVRGRWRKMIRMVDEQEGCQWMDVCSGTGSSV